MKAIIFIITLIITSVTYSQNYNVIQTKCEVNNKTINIQNEDALFLLNDNKITVLDDNYVVNFEIISQTRRELSSNSYSIEFICKNNTKDCRATLTNTNGKSEFIIFCESLQFKYLMNRL